MEILNVHTEKKDTCRKSVELSLSSVFKKLLQSYFSNLAKSLAVERNWFTSRMTFCQLNVQLMKCLFGTWHLESVVLMFLSVYVWRGFSTKFYKLSEILLYALTGLMLLWSVMCGFLTIKRRYEGHMLT